MAISNVLPFATPSSRYSATGGVTHEPRRRSLLGYFLELHTRLVASRRFVAELQSHLDRARATLAAISVLLERGGIERIGLDGGERTLLERVELAMQGMAAALNAQRKTAAELEELRKQDAERERLCTAHLEKLRDITPLKSAPSWTSGEECIELLKEQREEMLSLIRSVSDELRESAGMTSRPRLAKQKLDAFLARSP